MEQDFFGNIQTPFRAVNNKVIVPSDEEINQNPRSRSAKLRIAEKDRHMEEKDNKSHITLKSILGGDILAHDFSSARPI